jgi:hypothetical protein
MSVLTWNRVKRALPSGDTEMPSGTRSFGLGFTDATSQDSSSELALSWATGLAPSITRTTMNDRHLQAMAKLNQLMAF